MFIGRIPTTGGGWRVHGRAVAETIKCRQPVGYDDVRSLVDAPRLACSEVLGEEKGTTCAGFVIRAAASVAAHVLTPPQRTRRQAPDQPTGTNLMAGYA
jgi:hypothetical protein